MNKNKNFLKTLLCVCEGEMNSFVCVRKRGFKSEKKGEYTIQNFTQKEKGVTSWQANKQTKSTTSTKRARLTPQGMAKEGQDSFSLCGVEEEDYKEGKESTQREKNGGRGISIHGTAKREASNRNNASEPEKSITFLRSYSGRFISQRATKSEPRGSAVILGPAPTF